MYDAAIIGGGISGLTCAFKALKKHKKVLLLEPEHIGGVIHTLKKDDFILEQGPNVLLGKEDLLKLCDELQLKAAIKEPIFPRIKQYVWFKEKACRVPMSPPLLLLTPILSPLTKIKIFYSILSGKKLLLDQEDISVSDFFLKLLDKQVVSNLVAPALGGIFGGNVNHLSARSVFPTFWQGIKEYGSILSFMRSKERKKRPDTLSFEHGISNLTNVIWEQIKDKVTFIPEKALELKKTDEAFEITTEKAGIVKSSAVYIATSGIATAQYIDKLDKPLAALLTKLKYAPLVVVHVATAKDIELPDSGFGVLFPAKANSKLIGVMFNSLMFPHTAPPTKHLLTVCLGGINGIDVYQKPKEELISIVKEELAMRFKINELEVLEFWKCERAIPQYDLGHYQLIEAMEKLEKRYLGLYFRGADIGGIGVADRVRMGMK